MSQPESFSSEFSVESLAFERDDRLLFSDINLTVNPGDIVQVEGPNGCGKTTLLRIIATSLTPTLGKLMWGGREVSRHRQEYLGDLLFLGHLPGIKPSLSPEENLQWWRRLNRSEPSLSNKDVLSTIGLCGYEDVPCYTLSAGQQRRAALARLLITQAPLWVLDEPFTAIDKQGVSQLETLLTNHAKSGGMVIMSTHQDLGIEGVRRFALPENAGVS